jgi:dTDP-4-dehydrorhamnose reductase
MAFDWLVNAAGTTDVDDCERHPRLAHVVNAESTAALATECARRGSRLVQISTDYVFAGDGDRLLREDDPALPINAYGHSKLEGEEAALSACPGAVVARVSWLFGGEKVSFPDRVVTAGLAGDHVRAVNDKFACPTYAEDLAGWLLWLIQDGQFTGRLHLCNSGVASWQEYGQAALDLAASMGLPLRTTQVEGHTMVGFDRFIAARPPYTPLDTARFSQLSGITPRPWREALAAYLRSRY